MVRWPICNGERVNMVLDSKIMAVRYFYGLWNFADWSDIDSADVLRVHGVGRVTLDHIRLYLAAHGCTLKNDRTPEYWQDHLQHVRIAQQVTEDDDRSIACPFTIVIDSAEQQPFSFTGLRADADQQHRPLIVKTVWRSLGRHPNQLGDYSIDGMIGRVHVERKSIVDLQGTVLDFRPGGNRSRFERELANLSSIDSAMVCVEGSLGAVLRHHNERRKAERKVVAKQLLRSILAYQQDYSVGWMFCDSRRLAEVATFRFLERHWRKVSEREKESSGLLEGM